MGSGGGVDTYNRADFTGATAGAGGADGAGQTVETVFAGGTGGARRTLWERRGGEHRWDPSAVGGRVPCAAPRCSALDGCLCVGDLHVDRRDQKHQKDLVHQERPVQSGAERKCCEHLRTWGSTRCCHPHTWWHLQEDQVGPGDRRSLCGPSCLCHPVHRFHLCHHEDLGDPMGGDELSTTRRARHPTSMGTRKDEGQRRGAPTYSRTTSTSGTRGAGGTSGALGQEGRGWSEHRPTATPQVGRRVASPRWAAPSCAGIRAQGQF